MKFLINLRDLTICPLPQGASWRQLPNVSSNGQHAQLAGFVLAEYHPSEGELVLLHPETDPSSGHQDVRYYHKRQDGKYGVSIQMYHSAEIDFANNNEVERCWPSGGEHLFRTIVAAEEYLKEAVGCVPALLSYIVHTFQHTPAKSNLHAVIMT